MFEINTSFPYEEAACRDLDVTIFFPAGANGRRKKNGPDMSRNAMERRVADEYCSSCTVKTECLDLVLGYDSDVDGMAMVGVFGGTTTEDRRQMRVAAAAQVA